MKEGPSVTESGPRRSSRKRTSTALFVASNASNHERKKVATKRASKKPKSTNNAAVVEVGKKPRSPKKSSKKVAAPKVTTPNEKITKTKRKSPSSKTKRKASNTGGVVTFVSSDIAAIAPENPWIDMRVPPDELRPSATLTTGQSFSWIVVENVDGDNGPSDKADAPAPTDDGGSVSSSASSTQKSSAWGTHDATEWVGPLGNRVVSIKETPTSTQFRVLHGPTDGAEEYLRDYFQLETPLSPLYEQWSKHDQRLARIAKVIPGVRILRQDPIECLFSFICSSNNNIPRIAKMLAAFREKYGEYQMELYGRSEDGTRIARRIYSFPTLESLKSATDADLREMGLGYRAKYIVETRDLLVESGGQDFLMELRNKDAQYVQEELIKFSGIGRKVADCVALFSLDQAEAIPVDVHVWHIACREYDPSLSSAKSLTPTIYNRVGELFRQRFPTHAGWGHSLLFVAELPSFRGVLPEDIVAQMDEWREQELAKKAAKKASKKAVKKE